MVGHAIKEAPLKNILVVGYYGKNNLGDELFKDAFRELFPNFNFTFVDNINIVEGFDAIFFGGGSFLSDASNISKDFINQIKIPIYYIGVGTETDIHPIHLKLMKSAKLIATRSNIKKALEINTNSILIPDLVYSLQHKFLHQSKIEKSILLIPNTYTIPTNKDPHWKHNSWQHFKFEFSQFLDYLIEEKYKISFFSMCNDEKLNDKNAAIEIINMMNEIGVKEELDINNIGKYSSIITQRFHGIILAELARVPYLSIHHHDKLKSSFLNEGIFTSFYGCYKGSLIDDFNKILELNISYNLPIEKNIFEQLKYIVNNNF
jgi:hypothetical protein